MSESTGEAGAAAHGPAARNRSAGRGRRASRWWERLSDPRRGDPGTLAELRRCRSSIDAARVREAITLARQLGACDAGAPPALTRDVLDLARVLAHVRVAAGEHPMRAAGWKTYAGTRRESDVGAAERPRLSEARFRRLLQTGGGEERVAAFVRLVALLGDSAHVPTLAEDFLAWMHPEHGDRVREHWAFLYYHAADAAPPQRSEEPLPTDDEDAAA